MIRPAAYVALAVMLSATVAAQAPSFRAETRLVVLHATVTNSRGELKTGLDPSAFTVLENGRRQAITLFRQDDVPVSIGILLDNSGSMRTLRRRVEAAALAFVRASNPDDEVFIVNFADHARLDVPMTRDVRTLEAGIARIDAIGGTALRDAVHVAETYLHEHARWDRRALLIVTDGKDNASDTTMAQVQRDAERSETTAFGIGLFADRSAPSNGGRHELETITTRTGGVAYFPASVNDIESVAVNLAKQIRQQYTIGYTPTNAQAYGTYRTIDVRAVSHDHAERLTVRTRSGYRAAAAAIH
jgi:VWFA-related protein